MPLSALVVGGLARFFLLQKKVLIWLACPVAGACPVLLMAVLTSPLSPVKLCSLSVTSGAIRQALSCFQSQASPVCSLKWRCQHSTANRHDQISSSNEVVEHRCQPVPGWVFNELTDAYCSSFLSLQWEVSPHKLCMLLWNHEL